MTLQEKFPLTNLIYFPPYREINEVERILEAIFKETHYDSREHDFGCVHYLWPTTNIHLS